MTEKLGAITQKSNPPPQAATTTPLKTSVSQKSAAVPPKRNPPELYHDLDLDQIPKKLKAEFNKCTADVNWPIYLFGGAGHGKSYAMAGLFVAWDGSVLWHDVSSLLRKIMRCRMSEGGYFWEPRRAGASVQMFEATYMDRISQASLCCFDDVGLRSASDAMFDAFYEIVNLRKGKPTVYTGNLPPEELKTVYDGRIASRILAGTWIEMGGDDRRLSKSRMVKV